MQLLIGFLFGRAFLVAGAFSSQPQLHNLRLLITTLIQDLLHVASLGPNDLASGLEVVIVVDLYFVSASKLWNLLNWEGFLLIVELFYC